MIRIINLNQIKDAVEDYLLLDARPYIDYMSKGHIPGAVNAQVSRIMDVITGAIKPIGELNAVFKQWGIDEDKPILIYDEYDGQLGARLAWTLDYCGHDKVFLVREFFSTYANSGGQLSYKLEKATHEGNFKCRPNEGVRATAEYVLSTLNSALIIDARSPEEFIGGNPEVPRPGHIPNAVNIPWLELLDPDGYRIVDLGLSRDKEIIVYCDYGLRASVVYSVLRHFNYKVRLYEKGYMEWGSNPNLPVVSG
ncbi:sulfurtransferase [Caldivirga maquilingensis]|uniref:Rhodanese domain protein n=1 Tax=Caldivirga maquilingensis (strain ATCC 700844 / DSM 13496 / JCM 10307 / IC-167) TaxID=397948 RepID=A8MCC2_CALMQ|nr:rhodanese-like domain-containing protein [Caldivirga maquilingensis]ABW01428.1 Rhodanese domain protein [Caldivirga maquilingensis IC-167]